MIAEALVRIAGGSGIVLDGRLAVPATAAGGVAICHPHPQYGGDMDNPVVVRAAEVCQAARLATMRFNFRGVGGSTGAFDNGRGEQDDLMAAHAHLAGSLPAGAPIAVAGYSFGATIAARVAMRRRVAGLALIAPALAMAALADLTDLSTFKQPLLVVAGTADQYCPLDALERFVRSIPDATVRTIDGADHFFFGKLFPLGEVIAPWARAVAAQSP